MAYADTEPTLDVTQIWRVLALRWRLIAVFALAGLALAFIQRVGDDARPPASAAGPVEYRASASYMPVAVAGDIAPDEAARLAQSMAATYRVLLTSDAVLGALAGEEGEPSVRDSLPSAITVSNVSDTALLDVSVTLSDPQAAIDAANGLGDALARTPGYGMLQLGPVATRLDLVEPAEAALVAAPPASAPAPGLGNTLVLYVVLGLFVGLGAVFVVEGIDGRANWPQQVEGETGLLAIGCLEDRHRKTDPVSLFVTDRAGDIEAFREARARLKAGLPETGRGRSVLFTSPDAGEGKTTVVANLADALAEDGSEVIVVSSDLRSPGSIEACWGSDHRGPGLSDFLLDPRQTVDDILERTERARVSLVRRGSAPEAAVPVVDSARMTELVQQLTARADWVLFDSPAALEVADAQRLVGHMDGVLLVVDGTRSTLAGVRSAVRQLEDVGANLLGFFHNRYRGNPLAAAFRR